MTRIGIVACELFLALVGLGILAAFAASLVEGSYLNETMPVEWKALVGIFAALYTLIVGLAARPEEGRR